MKNIILEIRQQPKHIREIFMWSSVVIVFSFVTLIWFRSTEKTFVALLNPDEVQSEQVLAENKTSVPSPFASIQSGLANAWATFGDLLNIYKTGGSFEVQNSQAIFKTKIISPQKLPISGDK